jgi:hypothetical protein
MIIAEMRPADVPVEILGLEVEREAVRQDGIERAGDVLAGVERRSVGVCRRGVPL